MKLRTNWKKQKMREMEQRVSERTHPFEIGVFADLRFVCYLDFEF